MTLTACPTCRKPALDGFPHHHYTEPASSYNPMPRRPSDPGAMLAYLRAEYLAEIPGRIHTAHVPERTEPVPVDMADPDGPQIMVQDAGPLGGPPYAPPFSKRIGAWRFWEGEVTARDRDLDPFARGLFGVRRWCAGRHREWYEHDGRPLCWLLLRHVVAGNYTLAGAAHLEGVEPDKAARLVGTATVKWWVYTEAELNGLGNMRRPRGGSG